MRNFMVAEGGLGLPASQAYVYALIYQYSIDAKGAYFGSCSYLAARCGMSRRAAVAALQALEARGLIREQGSYRKGSNVETKSYFAVLSAAEAAKDAYGRYWDERAKGCAEALARRDMPERGQMELGLLLDGASPAPISGEESSPEISRPEARKTGPAGVSCEESSHETAENPQVAGISGEKTSPETPLAAVPGPISGEESSHETLVSGEKTSHESGVSGEVFSISCELFSPDDSPIQASTSDFDRAYILNKKKIQSVRTDGAQGAAKDKAGSEPTGWQNLADSSVNRNLIPAAREPYAALLAEGLSPASILEAWKSVQRECEEEGRPRRMYPQLKRWLEDRSPAGARAMARRASRSSRSCRHRHSQPTLPDLMTAAQAGELPEPIDAAFARAMGTARSRSQIPMDAIRPVLESYRTYLEGVDHA